MIRVIRSIRPPAENQTSHGDWWPVEPQLFRIFTQLEENCLVFIRRLEKIFNSHLGKVKHEAGGTGDWTECAPFFAFRSTSNSRPSFPRNINEPIRSGKKGNSCYFHRNGDNVLGTLKEDRNIREGMGNWNRFQAVV